MSNKKVLVHLHLYYLDQLDYMISKLKNICGCEWDLYVTLCNYDEKCVNKLKAFKPDVKIIEVENLGYDIWPFIQVLRMINSKDYDYVLKLHTKAKQGFPIKTYAWRNALIDSILISKNHFKRLLNQYDSDNTIGYGGRSVYWVSFSGLVPEEQFMLNKMMKRLNLRFNSNLYLSGTIFFARMSIFDSIISSNISVEDFDSFSKTGACASNAHVLERVFSFLAPNCGLRNIGLKYFSGQVCKWFKLLFSVELVYTERQKGFVLYLLWHRFPLKVVKRKKYVAPENSISCECTFEIAPVKNGRVAVFAGFCPAGKILESQIYYLKGLREIVDNIVFVCDGQVLPQEIEKLKELVSVCIIKRHNEYDFGSYKFGYKFLLDNNLLEGVQELILCNDSCYGPVFPFRESFESDAVKDADFWGYTLNGYTWKNLPRHIQSFFLVFRKNVFNSKCFKDFILGVKRQKKVQGVINKYEIPFTDYLQKRGFKSSVFVSEENFPYKKVNKTVYPLTLIRDYRMPLVKVKVFNNVYLQALMEFSNDTLDYIEQVNTVLAKIIRKENDL